MKAPKRISISTSRKLGSEVQLARLQLAKAKQQARLAKHRRKEAKEAARRAKKKVKLAKRAVAEARQVLAEAEKKLALTVKRKTAAARGKKATKAAPAPSPKSTKAKKPQFVATVLSPASQPTDIVGQVVEPTAPKTPAPFPDQPSAPVEAPA